MRLFGIGGKDAGKVLAEGEARSGRIIGIRVAMTHDDPPQRVDDYAIAADDGSIVGLRQRLAPDALVRLGMSVRTRVDGDTVAIDWTATVVGPSVSAKNVTTGWKRLKQPPAEGIVDETLGLERARKKDLPARVRIDAVQERSAFLGVGRAIDLHVTVRLDNDPEPYAAELKKADVPFYATHLAASGVELTAWVRERRLDRITLDWPAAAQARPGVGEPPVEALAVEPPAPVEAVGAVPSGGLNLTPEAGALGAIGGVDFQTYVAVEAGLIRDRVAPAEYDAYASERFGVPAGGWSAAADGWQQRIRSDWKLGAAFGEAFEAARRG
jgi:hypothetical protein